MNVQDVHMQYIEEGFDENGVVNKFDLRLPENVNIGGIIRNGQGMVVSGSTIILPGDHVVIFCMATSIRKIAKFYNN